jgi:hypothetical protein
MHIPRPKNSVKDDFGFSIKTLLIFSVLILNIQTNAQDKKNKFISNFEEIFITVYTEKSFSFETDILISDTNLIYLNVEDLFRKLKIKCLYNENILTGFIENESNRYIINFKKKQIKIGTISIDFTKRVIADFGVNYIEASVLSDAFGLSILFNPRSLSAKLTSSFELPFAKQMRIENTRSNISKLQGKPSISDTIITRNYHLFKLGTLDWSLSSFQNLNIASTTAISLRAGSELLYGESNVSLNYDDQNKFDPRQIQYNWRWIDNDKKIIKQAQLGNVSSQSIAFLNAPLIGATFNNSPNTIRKASGFFTINDYTEPNWTVELYINDILVDYTVADASGLYLFQVPIVYGYTTLKLKFYGLLGEERTEERTMNTPYTFVPPKTLEYSFTSGVLQDAVKSRFGQVGFNYGVSRFLTFGAGLEYLSSIPNHPFIPFAKVSFQPFPSMVLNFDYAHNVSTRGLMNVYFTESIFLEVDYTKFVEEQLARRFSALEELKVRFSRPFKSNYFSGFTRLNFNQFVYKSLTYNQFDFLMSTYYKQFNLSSSSFINWASSNSSFIRSVLALSYRLRNGLVVRSSAEYNLSTNNLVRFNGEIEMRVSEMYFSFSYARSIQSKKNNFFLSFRYDLPFARAGISSSYSNKSLVFSENAQGSLAFGGDNNYVHVSRNSAIGKGGVLFYPFLDLNQNGVLDSGEKKVLLSNVSVSSNVAVISKKDSIVRVSDLNAFVNYNVKFSDTDLDNISWRFKDNTYQILVDPNQYKRVYVPIISVGEVNGMVYLVSNKTMKGQARVTLQIYDKKGEKVAETLSEYDGYFSYLGLKPGIYSVRVDESQLKKLNYKSYPTKHQIIIKESTYGDFLEGLDFKLKSIAPLILKE